MFKVPTAYKLPLIVGALLVLGLGAWWFGARVVNGISRAVFHGQNTIIDADIQKDLDDKDAALVAFGLAATELAAKKVELAKAESDLANETAKRELAESILADKSKNTDAKVKAYEDALNAAPVVRVVPESVSEQCERAKALGLELAICNR